MPSSQNWLKIVWLKCMANKNTDISNTFIRQMSKFYHSGIMDSPIPNREIRGLDDLASLHERVDKILGIVDGVNSNKGNMLFFVMYDIESNKVRTQVVKYLQRMGCSRVQKSIFLANLSVDKYSTIRQDLTEVQAAYENDDSILVVPISTDLLQAMKIIGQNLEIEVITKSKNTLFF